MNIIEEIFYGNIDGVSQKASPEYKKACEKELKLYDELKTKLPTDTQELFENFVNATQNSSAILEKERYVLDFKTGVVIGIESKNY